MSTIKIVYFSREQSTVRYLTDPFNKQFASRIAKDLTWEGILLEGNRYIKDKEILIKGCEVKSILAESYNNMFWLEFEDNEQKFEIAHLLVGDYIFEYKLVSKDKYRMNKIYDYKNSDIIKLMRTFDKDIKKAFDTDNGLDREVIEKIISESTEVE